VSDEFKPLTAADVDDLHLLPGELRAFRSEVRDSLDAIARALQSLGRIEERLDVVIDRQNHLDVRIECVERDVSEDRKRIEMIERRVMALESKKPRKKK
jgi:hypothetical protein